VEFYTSGDDNDKKVLFTTSGRGLRTPQLWDQEVGLDEDDTYLYVRPKGDLDPELEKRLGNDPFDDDRLGKMKARVTVTRCSDMCMVELISGVPVPEEWGVDYDEGKHIYFDAEWFTHELPQGCMIVDTNDIVGPVGEGCVAVRDHSLALRLELETQTGRVKLDFLSRDDGHGILDEDDLDSDDVLKYLEVQCPWPADEN
jgi:hypothetical protein